MADDKYDIVVRKPEEAPKAQDLMVVVLMTRMGAQYIMPDVLQDHLNEFIRQIDWARTSGQADAQVVLRNLSGVVMAMPFRILAEVGIARPDTPLAWTGLWRRA